MESQGTTTLPKKAHIENRNLFNLASGGFSLRDWEQDHIQACEICQGVLYILLNQLAEATSGSNTRPADDAA
jgi:hypothetical protein